MVRAVGPGRATIKADPENFAHAGETIFGEPFVAWAQTVTVCDVYTAIRLMEFEFGAGCSTSERLEKKRIAIGETRQALMPRMDYYSTGNREIEWSAKNPSIATITKDGMIKGVGHGFATFVVQSKYPAKNSNEKFFAEITYHIGEYTDEEILTYLLKRKHNEELAFIDAINAERTNPDNKYGDGIIRPSYTWDEWCEEMSFARASYNIFHALQGGHSAEGIAPILPTHGESQNGMASTQVTESGYGIRFADSILSDPGHYMNNMYEYTKYAAVVFLQYKDPAGIEMEVGIETFVGTNRADAIAENGIEATRKDSLTGSGVPADEYDKYVSYMSRVS